MNKILMAAALCLVGMSAQATDYLLLNVKAFNPFVPTGSNITCEGCGISSATSDGSAVTTNDMAFSFINGNATFTYTDGDWSDDDL